MTSDPKDRQEDVDLDAEQRRYVLELHSNLDRLTHYELLGVATDADKKTIKQAFYRLAGVLHPDRYFGKRLGSYRAKLEAIFTRVSFAAETLSNAQRREEYDAEIGVVRASRPAPTPPPPGPPSSPSQGESEVERKRRVAREALNARFGDVGARAQERKASARAHASAAAAARAAGDLVRATESLRLACTFAPEDRALAAEYERTAREAAALVAASHERQAQIEERYGHWANAAASWRRVLDAKPGDPEATRRLAEALERARGR